MRQAIRDASDEGCVRRVVRQGVVRQAIRGASDDQGCVRRLGMRQTIRDASDD